MTSQNKLDIGINSIKEKQEAPPAVDKQPLEPPQGPRWLEANEDHKVGPSFYNHHTEGAHYKWRGGRGGRRGHRRGRGITGCGSRWPHVRRLPY